MHIDLAKTFLAIVRYGSFVAAADHLCVSQTAVTARVRSLEQQFGCSLFKRTRQGAELTEQGRAFLDPAQDIVQAWERAKRQVATQRKPLLPLRLGAEISLSYPLMPYWVGLLREHLSQTPVRVSLDQAGTLQDRLLANQMDLALLHQPHYNPALQVELLLEEKLIQVQHANQPEPYIYNHWGPAFSEQHDLAITPADEAWLQFDQGPMALHYLLNHGGRGYFRRRVVDVWLEKGLLQRVPDTPEFNYPVYMVWHRHNEHPHLTEARELLQQQLQAGEPDWSQRGPESLR